MKGNDKMTRYVRAGLAMGVCALLSACSATADPGSDAEGWSVDAGVTCPRPSADIGLVEPDYAGEKVCGDPLDELRGYSSLTNFDHTCDVFRGDIRISATNGQTDLTVMPPLRVVAGKLSLKGTSLESLDGLQRLEQVGRLYILGFPALEHLQGMDNLRRVDGTFELRHLAGLQNFRGMESLESVGQLAVDNCDGLQNLEGLEGLRSIDESLSITGSDAIQDLSGISGLEYVDILTISANNNLTSVSGAHSLRSVGKLGISSNPRLRTLDGLSQLECVHGDVHIGYNDSLPEEEVQAFLQRIEVGGEVVREW